MAKIQINGRKIALKQNFISYKKLASNVRFMPDCEYKEYLQQIIKEEISQV